MRVDIVVVYVPRYVMGHEKNFTPPLTGIHLAALTPSEHEVRVIHQQVEPVPLDTDADLVALSFFSGFADEAYRLAGAFRARGKRVVAGGPHATFWPEETLAHCDAVVCGEAETVWATVLADAFRARGIRVVAGGPHATFWPEETLAHCDAVVCGEAETVWSTVLTDASTGRLKRRYEGEAADLAGIPTPRYDLLPRSFFVQRVVQATRGCPYACSFCSVPQLNPGFRMRPVEEVLRDVRYDAFPRWWQRKIVWFWDDNLTINRPYIKELLRAMQPLNRWWLTQASMDIAEDPELLSLMANSGCIGVFFGIETFGDAALRAAHKPQNQVARYRRAIAALHQRGVCVMAGFVAGFDGDTPEDIVRMAEQLDEIGVDVPFISILTPYRGTPLHAHLEASGRLLPGRGADYYNGYNVAFEPQGMSSTALLAAHRALWRRAFSPRRVTRRLARAARQLRPGAFWMSAAMNGFYGLKRIRGNLPRVAG